MTRVALVADSLLVRASLRALLSGEPDLELVEADRTAQGASGLPEAPAPVDVALVAWERDHDLSTLLADYLGEDDDVPAVVVTDLLTPERTRHALDAGARGLLPAGCRPSELAAALRAAAAGLLAFHPAAVRAITAALPEPAPAAAVESAEGHLSARELQVLALLADGLPNKAIARRLGISDHTVKFHVGAIMAKLGATSRTEAVTRAARRGLLML